MWRCITSPRVAPLELNPLFLCGSYKQVAPTELREVPLNSFYKLVAAKWLAHGRRNRYLLAHFVGRMTATLLMLNCINWRGLL